MSKIYLPSHCNEVLKEIAEKMGFKNYEININIGSTKGDHFLSLVYSVKIHGRGKDSPPDLNVIIKVAPDGTCRESALINLIFSREVFAYNKVFKALDKLQDESGIKQGMQYDFVKCFSASDVDLREFIVMEDLRSQGFQMIDKKDSIDINVAKLVLNSLAKLHGASLALERKHPELFLELTSKIPDILCCEGGNAFENPMAAGVNLASKVIKDPILKKNFQAIVDGGFTMVANCLKPQSISTVCHGDCWINNVLTKYNENGKPTEVRLFDFQSMRYAPPATDVLHFLITSTDGKFRADHFNELIDFYYDKLSESLQAYSYKVEDVLPKEEFFKQLKLVSPYVITMGAVFANLLNRTQEDSMDTNDLIDTKEFTIMTGNSYDEYVQRVNDIVKDCAQYGYFD